MPNILSRAPHAQEAPPVANRPHGRRRPWLALAGFIAVSMAAGAIGSIFTAQSVGSWYPTLARPPLSPPSWVFGPVWTSLYAMMGTSAWLIWRRRHRPGARRLLGLFGGQLALNTAWSGLFFGLQSPAAGLIGILPLWGLIGAYTVSAWRISRGAAARFAPERGWVSIATYLNAGYWWLNR